MYTPQLELDDIQGDMPVGMQKNAELFLFFKITDAPLQDAHAAIRHRPGDKCAHDGGARADHRGAQAGPTAIHRTLLGLNLGFTWDGLKQLLGARRPKLDPAFERGSADPTTVALLNFGFADGVSQPGI